MAQDRLQRARERYADAVEAMREQHERMREDLRFSNPADPQQWSADALEIRGSRPCLTFDNTNKFIRQVVNSGRGSTQSIQVTPADGFADARAAEQLNGRIRHIEYISRARIAYDTALNLSARCGLGWLRIIPEVLNTETNHQEPRILRVHDPLSCVLDPDSTEPDGSDSEWGFVLSPFSRKKFKRQYPKARATEGWSDPNSVWTYGDTILVAEYFEIVRLKKTTKLLCSVPGPDGQPGGDTIALTEEEYMQVAQTSGVLPQIIDETQVQSTKVTWSKMTGQEEIEETDFPSKYIPLVPVIGEESWVDGKRYLCGLTRQLMDGQRMHNAEMSSMTEAILSQPKAPFMVAMEAMEGHDAAWKKLNTGNPSFLPYNHVDTDGNPVPPPSRLAPPPFPVANANGATIAITEMEGAVGMYKSSFGQQSNAISGIAKISDRRESDTGTFHYPDNLGRSLEHLGRIIVDMDRKLADTARTVSTRTEDGKSGTLRYDPQLPTAVRMKNQDVDAINPQIGEYDLAVKIGPSFLTQNEETAAELGQMFQSQPQLLPILGPLWVQMKGIPNGELVKKILTAIAPPPVQEIYAQGDQKDPLSPAAKHALQQMQQQLQQMQQQNQQLAQALENAAQAADKTQGERVTTEADLMIRGYQAVTERLKVTAPALTPQQISPVTQQTVAQALVVQPGDTPGMPDAPPMPVAADPNATPSPTVFNAGGAGNDAQPVPTARQPQ